MSYGAEQPIEQPQSNHLHALPVTDWPVREIPRETVSSEAAARVMNLLPPLDRAVDTPRPPTLEGEEREVAAKFGTLFTKFEEDIRQIMTDTVEHRDTKESVPHYFAVKVSGTINRPDEVYNLGFKKLTDEGFEVLSNKYLPGANWKKQPLSSLSDGKPASHGERTDSGKIKVIFGQDAPLASGRKVYADWQRAASNDPIEEGDDE